MRFLRQSVTGLFLVSLTVALMMYAGNMVVSAVSEQLAGDTGKRPVRERVFTVNVQTAHVGTSDPELETFGRVESRRTLELRAAVPGRVIWLSEAFQEGGTVQQGDILVEIDKTDAQFAQDRAEADIVDAHANLRDSERALDLARDELKTTEAQAILYQRSFDRQKNLKDRGVGTEALVETAELAAAQADQEVITSRQALAQAEADLDQAKSQLTRAEITLSEAKRDLADATVTAPFTGTLQTVSLVEGRLVAANEILAELVDPERLEAAFRISTLQYARLLDDKGGLRQMPVTVTLDATGAALSVAGEVSRASGATGTGQSGRLLYAHMVGAKGFKPGDFVTVAVKEPSLVNVVRLPSSVLDAQHTVLVLGAEDRLEVVPVELMRRQGDDVLLRAQELDGREVVTGRTPLLGQGIRVRPLRQDEDSTAAIPDEVIELSDERRAQLTQFVREAGEIPAAAKDRALNALAQAKVSAALVSRIESRMGG